MVGRLSRWLELTAIVLLASSLAHAEEAPERVKARELGYAGVHAYQAADYVAANEELTRAYALFPVPSLGLWSARAKVKLGQLVEGAERYREVTKLGIVGGNEAVQRQAQLDAERELGALLGRIPRVRFRLQGAAVGDVLLSVDDVVVPIERIAETLSFNPGAHRVVARRGEQRVELGFEALEGVEREVLLDFGGVTPKASVAQPAPAPRSPGSRRVETLAWVSIGAGSAGLVLGTVSGLLASSKKASLEDSGNCWEDHCEPVESDRVSSYNSLRHLSTVGFVAGGALAATGLVLLVAKKRAGSDPRASAARALVLRAQPRGALLSGSF
jgi:hypothetical protein